jgi:hypothetical protein
MIGAGLSTNGPEESAAFTLLSVEYAQGFRSRFSDRLTSTTALGRLDASVTPVDRVMLMVTVLFVHHRKVVIVTLLWSQRHAAANRLLANFILCTSIKRRHRLTVYDAVYLELALRHGATLASLDAALLAAAKAEAVRIVS